MTICPGSNTVAGAREDGTRMCRICDEDLPAGVTRDANFQVWMPEHHLAATLCQGSLGEPERVGDDLACGVCGGVRRVKIKSTWLVIEGKLRVPPHRPRKGQEGLAARRRDRHAEFGKDLGSAIDALHEVLPGDWTVTQMAANTWVLRNGQIEVTRWSSPARVVGGMQGLVLGVRLASERDTPSST